VKHDESTPNAEGGGRRTNLKKKRKRTEGLQKKKKKDLQNVIAKGPVMHRDRQINSAEKKKKNGSDFEKTGPTGGDTGKEVGKRGK